MTYPSAPLGEIASVVPGYAFKSADWSDEGTRVIRIKSLAHGAYVDLDQMVCVPAEVASRAGDRFVAQGGDLLIAMTGATAGKVSRMRPGCTAMVNQRVARVQARSVDPRYLWAVMSSLEMEERLYRLADGAAQPNMSGGQLERFLVPVAPEQTQRRIAAILSAYDDLIEVNTQRIAILEEMAQRIYEEWFVRNQLIGPNGARDWRTVALSDVADVNPDTLKPRSAPSTIRYIDISSVSTGSVDHLQEMPFSDAPSRARRTVKADDILWSCVRPNRRSHVLLGTLPEHTIASTGFAVLRARNVPASFLYRHVTADSFVKYLENSATGAAYPAVKASDFESAPIACPSKDMLRRFDAVVRPMDQLADELQRMNANLRAQRDILLPRLVSGKLSVDDAERQVEEDAA